MQDLLSTAPEWLRPVLLGVAAILIALLAHWGLMFALRRTASHTQTATDDIVIARLASPARYLMVILALSAVQPTMDLPPSLDEFWSRIVGLAMPALFGWLAIAVLGIVKDLVEANADISVADNLRARRRRTQATLLYRIALFLVLLITFCMMLITFPGVRAVGVTLLASAGLAGLAVGAAAQPALKNLVAGIQMAFTEPIRIDDVVIVDGEWGRIEQIWLTFVVVRIWDERRLIVPISKFLEDSFQNWTRESSEVLGTAFLYVDLTADVPRIRAKLEEVVKANSNWDGRVMGLLVTGTNVDWLELRALVSAADAGQAFALRCEVREAMSAFLANEMPEALPRRRGNLMIAESSAQQ